MRLLIVGGGPAGTASARQPSMTHKQSRSAMDVGSAATLSSSQWVLMLPGCRYRGRAGMDLRGIRSLTQLPGFSTI